MDAEHCTASYEDLAYRPAIRSSENGRPSRDEVLAQLIGKAPAFEDVVSRLPALAKADAVVLITGETGTGKEMVARAIHQLSRRAAFPFVAVNCGALVDTLLEAELFFERQYLIRLMTLFLTWSDSTVRRLLLIALAS